VSYDLLQFSSALLGQDTIPQQQKRSGINLGLPYSELGATLILKFRRNATNLANGGMVMERMKCDSVAPQPW
jgi:hypothetical protein